MGSMLQRGLDLGFWISVHSVRGGRLRKGDDGVKRAGKGEGRKSEGARH